MKSSQATIPAWVLTIVFLLLSASGFAQQCTKRSALVADSDVFDSPPSYVTGSGWRGHIEVRLSAGTAVYICRQTQVDFGFSSKTWVQIAYRSGSQWPTYGWVISDALRTSSTAPLNFPSLAFLIPAAHADTGPTADTNENQLPETPPAVPPLTSNASAGGSVGNMSLGSADLFNLYIPLFVAMILGMFAKVVVDLLDTWDKGILWGHLRNGIIAILVSPIVFLGLLTAGQFSGSTQTFVVLALLAFQNGFFWQTVLKRDSDRTGERTILAGKRGR
jgi:hypothetical protein